MNNLRQRIKQMLWYNCHCDRCQGQRFKALIEMLNKANTEKARELIK